MNYLNFSEINGVVVCFKLGPVTHRPPPSVPLKNVQIKDIENSLHYINITGPKPMLPVKVFFYIFDFFIN